MAEEHQRQRRVVRGQPGLGRGDARPAPVVHAGVRLGVEQVLVRAHDAGLVRLRERLLLGGGRGRAERVVVQREQRRDRHRAALALPDRPGILGSVDPQPPAQLHQVLVARLAAQLDRVVGGGPQLVVAGRPQDAGEAVGEQLEGALDVVEALGDVAGDDQPVVVRGGAQ